MNRSRAARVLASADTSGPDNSSTESAALYPQTLLRAPGELSRQDASALQLLLLDRFGDTRSAETDAANDPVAPVSSASVPPSHVKSRLIKSALGLALVAAVGWMPAQRLFQVSSVEAVVNARLVTVRSPINGIVAGGHQTEKQPRCAINNAEKRRFTDAKAARVRGLQAR